MATPVRNKKNIVVVDFEAVDKQIITAIDRLYEVDKKIWNSPDHNRRDNVHGFFQYPAMMVPVVQKHLINTVVAHRPDIKTMIDPFLGAGTSIVAAMQSNLSCYGQDINPLAILLSKVKVGPYYYEAFKIRARSVIEQARKNKSKKIVKDVVNRKKWFKEKAAIELSRLVTAIRMEESIVARRLFWVTLAETVRLTSNDRTSTYKLHARPKKETKLRKVSPIDTFEELIKNNIEDVQKHATSLKELKLINHGAYKNVVVISSVDSAKKIKKHSTSSGEIKFDLLVSSPPYGDNKTTIPYGQHAYLPLQWIDLEDIDNKIMNDCLKSASEIDSRSLGGKMKHIDLFELEWLYNSSPTLESTVNKLRDGHIKKIKKVVNFILDFDRSLDVICESIKVNGYMIWTIGNRNVGGIEVRNDKILIELLAVRGVKLVKIINRKILNKRMAKRNQSSATMNREKILLFRNVSTEG